jgi:hypothetical protein
MKATVNKRPTLRLVEQFFNQMPQRLPLYFTKNIQIIRGNLGTHKKANVYTGNPFRISNPDNSESVSEIYVRKG